MEFYKAIVLLVAGLLFICIPVFILFFVKMLYHYQKMIFGIKKDTYSKGYFILGPFLLADEKYFSEEGNTSKMLFFSYLKKASILFVVMSLMAGVIALIQYVVD